MIAASVFLQPSNLVETKKLIPPPPHLEYFSFGYQMPIADGLWTRALQDFDYCEDFLAKNLCRGNGWLFQMLETITNLAPDYQIAYRTGGLALTVIVSDYAGASKIFDKGVKMFPNDRQLLYRAAYHAMVEEKDSEKAAGLLVRAAQNGGSQWFYSLAAKLYTQAGKKELAGKLYDELRSQGGINEGTLKRIQERIENSDSVKN